MITLITLSVFVPVVLLLFMAVSVKKRKAGIKHTRYSPPSAPIENPKKAALHIPGYYEDIVNKEKLKKSYSWEVSELF